MHKSNIDNFEIPPELIASYPLENRDESRMLFYDRKLAEIQHKSFKDISSILQPGDLLVRNNSKVMPARLEVSSETGAKIEILLLKKIAPKSLFEKLTDARLARNVKAELTPSSMMTSYDERNAAAGTLQTGSIYWQVLAKPAKRLKADRKYFITENLAIEIIHEEDDIFVKFNSDEDFNEAVNKYGSMPIPPYMKREAGSVDKERYQTVYAKDTLSGASAAAPTAGLHFTPEIITQLQAKGIEILDVTLHVGLGTFLPIKVDNYKDHKMHFEYYEIEEDVYQKILEAKKQSRRVIAVGTTSVRTLESVAQTGLLKDETNIFIYPGYEFKLIDGMLTNFHLPDSTLILLVAAFLGEEKTKEIYLEAIKEKYRFYSYGDCCLFL